MSHYKPLRIELLEVHGVESALKAMRLPKSGKILNDSSLSSKLIKAGGSHAKFSRGIIYWLKYDMQGGFFLELDTYRHGREVLSTSSSMHNELKNLSGPELAEQKQADLPDKVYTQIATYSAQCLRKIYIERRRHRHPDWQLFCDFIERLDFFEDFIMPEVER